MKYIPFILIIIFIVYPIISAKIQLEDDNKNKAYTPVTAIMSIAIIMYIALSIAIAVHAEKPSSIGFGGFYYIFGPGLIGTCVLAIYLIALGFKPNQKFMLGIISVLVNATIGVMFWVNIF